MKGDEFRIFETRQFSKDLEDIAKSGQSRIRGKLREVIYPQLRGNPYIGPNIKKLKAYSPDTRRCRIGSWRFFYEVDDKEKIVFMIAASHRGSAD